MGEENKTCLSGKTFNITSFDLPNRFGINPNSKEIEGFAGELWIILANALNFTLNANIFTKGRLLDYGSRQKNGSWTGLLSAVQTEYAHILPLLMMDNERREIIHYTIPFDLSGFKLVVKTQSSSYFSWLWPLSPFSTSLWCAEIMCLLLISLTIYLGHWTATRIMNRKGTERDFIGDLLHVYGSLCCQGQSTKNFMIAASIAALTGSIFGYVLIQSYAANFVSHITAVSIWHPPFNDLEGLIHQDYKVSVLKGTFVHLRLKDFKEGIYKKLWDRSFISEKSEDGYIHACSSKVAIFVSDTTSRVYGQCDLILANNRLYFSTWKCSALSRDFPCKRLIDITMMRVRESGVLQKLHGRYTSAALLNSPTNYFVSSDVDNGVELKYIAPIIILYAAGIIMAILMLTFERFVASMTASNLILLKCVDNPGKRYA